MPTIHDVEAKREAAITQLRDLVSDAITRKNTAPTTKKARWQQVEDSFGDQLTAMLVQNYEGDLAAAQSAFGALTDLTKVLVDVAGVMTTVTQVLDKLADVAGAVNTAVDAMKRQT